MDRLAARAAGGPGRPIPAGLRRSSGHREDCGGPRRGRRDRRQAGAYRHHQRAARTPGSVPPGRGAGARRRHRHPSPVRGRPGRPRRHRAVPDRPCALEGGPGHQPRRPGPGRGQPRGGGRQAQALRRPDQGPRHQRTRVHRSADRRAPGPGADCLGQGRTGAGPPAPGLRHGHRADRRPRAACAGHRRRAGRRGLADTADPRRADRSDLRELLPAGRRSRRHAAGGSAKAR